ncbi:hypothetical protein J6TS7_33550 [Paenibacillus dendritiformis]|nr:hypothetical protein J6TS7_33550 [Paenibacillus dendritiformis]
MSNSTNRPQQNLPSNDPVDAEVLPFRFRLCRLRPFVPRLFLPLQLAFFAATFCLCLVLHCALSNL